MTVDILIMGIPFSPNQNIYIYIIGWEGYFSWLNGIYVYTDFYEV